MFSSLSKYFSLRTLHLLLLRSLPGCPVQLQYYYKVTPPTIQTNPHHLQPPSEYKRSGCVVLRFYFQKHKMVKLTPDIIEGAGQYINPIRDRELDLRGYKIPVIENLGAALDQYDTIDFSDNEIRKLDGFPYMHRVKNLMLNNNRIVRIGEGLELCLPNLSTLILTNNSLQELADLEPLNSSTKLEFLSLLHNPVVTRRNYREYVIHKFPNLR